MFKAIGNFIHRTPWWAMVLLGISTLMLMVVFSFPAHVVRLADSGATPEESRAIKREIDRAFGDSALNVAENIVGAIKDRSNDPQRKQELDHALAEIAQARKEIFNAQRDAGNAAREVVRDAQNAALEAAQEAAETALEAAKDTREAIEEAKNDAVDKLKASGADSNATLRAFDDMIKAAKEKERAAKDAVRKIATARKTGVGIGLNMGDGGFKLEVDPDTTKKPGISISIDSDGASKEIVIPAPRGPEIPAAPTKSLPKAAPAAP
ncbi:MAG: hypothetical protein ABI905_15410, partial [Betaproteobacteria bacterium]